MRSTSTSAMRPRFVYGAGEQELSPPSPVKWGEQAEVGDFHRAVIVPHQLEKTGRYFGFAHYPKANVGIPQVLFERVIAPA